ncbi:retrovirus-related pol polyprotein from transposon TNT 1-94 [Tanacetum coccineum]
MSSNSDDIQAADSDTRPPMLDRTDYDSWSQRIRLYCRGKENGIYILQSIDHGLPNDIYKLINHNIEAKAIWDNVKMLLAGSELTKEDSESQLYDEFERFKMLPGENINEYYVRFHKLVNDIRNIRMTMPNIQLNSKFVNNMSPEWDRNFARGAGAARNGGAQNRAGNANAGQGKPIKCYNCNGLGHIARNCTQPKSLQNFDFFKDKMLLMQAQENGSVLDDEELLFLADECDAFDSDVDDEPNAQFKCFIIVALELSKGANSLQAEEEPAPSGETSAPPAPKTAKQLAARRNQERVKSILLLAIPDEYLLKFHNVADAKSLWEAIKSRFQKLISQLEVHGAPISNEDINQKFLRSLPPSWNQIALIMRNKPDIDEIDIDDLYNNLKVYEDEFKRSSGSNFASQNLAFLSSKNTSSTNEVSTDSRDFGVSTAGGINQVPSTLCAHDVDYSFFAQPTTNPQRENEDFQQMDGDDLEELDL